MRRSILTFALLLSLLALTYVNFRLTQQRHVPSHEPRTITTDTFARIAQEALPQTVNIYVTGINPNLPEIPAEMLAPRHSDLDPDDLRAIKASGSGVVVDQAGLIVTNNHLFNNMASPEIEVHLYDGRVYTGDQVTLIARDRLTDLALIHLDAHGLSAARFGDSDRLNIGDWVVAVGNPLELASTVTQGIVSAKYRETDQGVLVDFIQSSAHIDPGSSGGALLNVDGELVGINTAIATETDRWEGFGFALPSNTVREVVNHLKTVGHVPRGYIGINFESRDELIGQMARRLLGYHGPGGVMVLGVQTNGPADLAGMKRHDVVTTIAGQPITNGADLLRTVASLPIGTVAEVEVWRGDVRDSSGHHLTLDMPIGERPADDEIMGTMTPRVVIGPSVPQAEPMSLPEAGLTFEWSRDEGGKLMVTKVQAGSAADEAGFEVGDTVLRVNDRPMLSPFWLWAALRLQSENVANHSFLLWRNENAVYINLDAEDVALPPAPEAVLESASGEAIAADLPVPAEEPFRPE